MTRKDCEQLAQICANMLKAKSMTEGGLRYFVSQLDQNPSFNSDRFNKRVTQLYMEKA